MGIWARYLDDEGRICEIDDGRSGDLGGLLRNYHSCSCDCALCAERENAMSGRPTRTVDEEIHERTLAYQKANAVADYRTAMQKVLDADPALKAAYAGASVQIRATAKAGALADLDRPQDAEVEEARKRLWKRAHELSKLDPISATLQAIQENPELVAVLLEGRG